MATNWLKSWGRVYIVLYPPLSKKGVEVMEMIRVNTRISTDMNKWLDKHSKKTGLPKSTIIMMAIEDYRKEKEVMQQMADIGQIVAKLDKLEKKIEQTKES